MLLSGFSVEDRILGLGSEVSSYTAFVERENITITIFGIPRTRKVEGGLMVNLPTRVFQQPWDAGGYYLNPELVFESEAFSE